MLPEFFPFGSKLYFLRAQGFPGSSSGKESACNAGNPSSIPGLERSTGEGIGSLLQYSWASLVAQLIKNPPTMRETWVQSDRKSTRLNSSHPRISRMPSSA